MHNTDGFNVQLMREDMRDRGWLPIDLARQAGVSHMTVSRFLSGLRQTPRMAKRLAEALGFTVRRYVITASTPSSDATTSAERVA